MTAPARPVQLQVNLAGAWKTVIRFDASDDLASQNAQEGALRLHEADPASSWRITTRDSYPVVLRQLGRNTYGLWMDRSE